MHQASLLDDDWLFLDFLPRPGCVLAVGFDLIFLALEFLIADRLAFAIFFEHLEVAINTWS